MIGYFLYLIFIYPIEMFIETVFTVSMKVSSNPGISIIFVSLLVQILVLPLYKRAEAMQEAERLKQDEMKPMIDHIKKTFKKDERFMMLSTYYRQQNYEPLMSLRGTLSLLLQIPFFIAAFHYLSNLELLKGTPFLAITDLGAPDGLIKIGGLSVNLLPILMTLINVISGAIYTKGHGTKEKVQLYVTAAIFLVLLYTSPAGLVFYWTLNNLFSLGKNIVMKILHLPKEKEEKSGDEDKADLREYNMMFVLSACVLAVFAGLWVPALTVADSPLEFVVKGHYVDPTLYVFEAFAAGIGIFVLWLGIFYVMAGVRGKRIFAYGALAVAVCSLIQMFFFSKNMGNMSNIMVYDFEPVYPLVKKVLNLAVLVAVVLVVFMLARKYGATMTRLTGILLVGMLAISIKDIVKAEGILSDNAYIKDDAANSDDLPKYTLSRNGKNVIVFMLDRGLNGYVPYLMEEFPQLKEQFVGFTYYPNTYSYGSVTLMGAPALYGGYDYMPFDTVKDPETIHKKLDSSIRLLPYNFSAAGYRCNVFDPPDFIDLTGKDVDSFFEDIPNTHGFDVGGNVKSRAQIEEDTQYLHKWAEHNYIRHSLYIMAPLALRSPLYDGGNYLSQDRIRENQTLVGELRELELLPDMADISDGSDDNLFVVTNLTAHSYAQLQLPDFTLSDRVDNSKYLDEWNKGLHELKPDGAMELDDMTDTDRFKSYCANVASFLAIGKWMDYLREEGVYDNTRIIIVADHGFYPMAFPQMIYEGGTSFEQFNPVLMVKDFGSRESSVSEELMSNADTVRLAVEGIISDPIDPYDGSVADITGDKSGDITVTDHDGYDIEGMESRMYKFHDDVRDPSNWEVLFSE